MIEYDLDKRYIIEDLKDAISSIVNGILEMKELIRILDINTSDLDDNVRFLVEGNVETSLVNMMNLFENEYEDDESDEEDE